MSTVREIVQAAEAWGAEDFLKLRSALDRIQEQRWEEELDAANARHRKAKFTDAKIDGSRRDGSRHRSNAKLPS